MDRLEVDGSRPAVALVAELPRSYKLTDAEWRVLMVLACDSYDGHSSAPGVDNIARWAGLFRSSAAKAIARLLEPTEHRPALLGYIDKSSGRRRTEYALLLPVDNEPNRPVTPTGSTVYQPSGEPSTNRPAGSDSQPSGEPSGHAGHSLSLDTPSPSPKAEAGQHEHHGNAERALSALALPLPIDELVQSAYAIGRGNPWTGYLEIKGKATESLDGARDPLRVLRARLKGIGA